MRSILNKKGDLSLSVNSIVIFVLAFALLGVGLFVTNLIRENIESGIGGIIPITEIANKPDASNPVTIPPELNIKGGGQLQQQIGYYNKETTTITATLEIPECISPEDPTGGGVIPPSIVAPSVPVDFGTGVGFNAIISDDGDMPPGSYVCTLNIVDDSTGNPVETKQFFLNVGA